MDKEKLTKDITALTNQIDNCSTGVRLYQELTDVLRSAFEDNSLKFKQGMHDMIYFKEVTLNEHVSFDMFINLTFPIKTYRVTKTCDAYDDVYITHRPLFQENICFIGKYINDGKKIETKVEKSLEDL